LPHLWAHQTQEQARNAQSTESFQGSDYYSYGTVIASIASNRKGERAYLVSDRSYSVTTSRHQTGVRMAIPAGVKEFSVPGVNRGEHGFSDQQRIMSAWTEEVSSLLDSAGTARQPKKNRLILEASAVVERMREFSAFFAIKWKTFPVLPTSPDELSAMLAVKAEKEAKTLRAREASAKRERARRQKESMAKRDAWLAGEYVGVYSWEQYHETLLRIVGDNVETSRGVTFPVSHARRGLALVESVIKRGEEWQRNGHTCHLGHYQIDRIEPNGTVHAGCHVVPYSSIARIREALLASKDGE
jgi:hypothetical protein